jgi:hypothetical protein
MMQGRRIHPEGTRSALLNQSAFRPHDMLVQQGQRISRLKWSDEKDEDILSRIAPRPRQVSSLGYTMGERMDDRPDHPRQELFGQHAAAAGAYKERVGV